MDIKLRTTKHRTITFLNGSNNLLNYFEFEPVLQEEMLFKDISYLELWQPLYFMEQNQLCNFKFGRVHHEEQFCAIILKFRPVVQMEYHLKKFLI